MKTYATLTRAGKLRRLHEMAYSALARYPLENPRICYHTFATNLLYRISTASGEQYMLRLAAPGWRTFEDLYSEALWLNALRRDTDIPAPYVLPALSGELVLPLSQPEIPDTWNATLMSRVPGHLLGHHLNQSNLQKMGVLFARLHQHGARWVPPAGFSTRRFEHWLSRGEENRILGAGCSPQAAELPAHWRDLLERASCQVEAAYAAVDRADLRVIHCDLWHDNIKIHRGELYPFDFEDTVWGFRAHDIAMAMLDLMETCGDAGYPQLLAAFRRGYETLADWPEERIEPFQVGRLLWKMNWVAHYEPGWLADMVMRCVAVLEHYERSGQVINVSGS